MRAALFWVVTRRVVVIYSYNKTKKMHQFLKFIFGLELYMFRTGFLSIIRSLVLYDTAMGICHTGYGDCLLANSHHNLYVVLCIQY